MKKKSLSLAVASFFLAMSAEAALPVYDAADQFSITGGNPNGVWSYGSLPTINGAFSKFTESLTISGLTSWRRNEVGTGTPGFYFNPTAGTFTNGETTLLSGQLMCAPGNSSMCTLRFIAPEAERYEITSSFIGLLSTPAKPSGTTTDVLIAKDGVLLTPALAIRGNGAASEKVFSTTLDLAQGAILDFAVSGAFDGFARDSTGMEVRIAVIPVPEPEAYALILAGLGLVGWAVGRRRKTSRSYA